MAQLTHDELRTRTLGQQFPDPSGTGAEDAHALLSRLGPIQSQVPRAPFLTLSSRLPGIDHATITALFAEHRLLKASNLRGTVHTSVREQFGWLDAVARAGDPRRPGLLLRGRARSRRRGGAAAGRRRGPAGRAGPRRLPRPGRAARVRHHRPGLRLLPEFDGLLLGYCAPAS